MREQATDSDVCNTPDELIASADAAKRAAPLLKRTRRCDTRQQAVHF
jgi:hypothetical protein